MCTLIKHKFLLILLLINSIILNGVNYFLTDSYNGHVNKVKNNFQKDIDSLKILDTIVVKGTAIRWIFWKKFKNKYGKIKKTLNLDPNEDVWSANFVYLENYDSPRPLDSCTISNSYMFVDHDFLFDIATGQFKRNEFSNYEEKLAYEGLYNQFDFNDSVSLRFSVKPEFKIVKKTQSYYHYEINQKFYLVRVSYNLIKSCLESYCIPDKFIKDNMATFITPYFQLGKKLR